MQQFTKYPRTMHAPWSLGVQSDDKVITSMDAFIGARVIVTEKLDGENTTFRHDVCHARSPDSRHHPSRNWVKAFHAQVAQYIPEGCRICGENVYAKHSIAYDALESYFYGFSLWDNFLSKDTCLSWDDTLEHFEIAGITPVPVLYDGIYDEAKIRALWDPTKSDKTEGYVIRVADAFSYEQFATHMAKFVRAGHVQTDEHWMHKEVIPNKLHKPVL